MKAHTKSFELKKSNGNIYCWVDKLVNGNYSFHYGYEEDELTYKELKLFSQFLQQVLKESIKE